MWIGRTQRFLPLLVLAVVFVVQLMRTWGTWPDVLVDFGQQLYLPWRLAEGEVLHRDLATYNGPLSQYVNALAFTTFGASLRVLALLNLLLLVGGTTLLFRMFTQVASRAAATAACLVFLALFAFGQYVGIGNYNFVTPYSHEVMHGFWLSLAGLACAWRAPDRGLVMVAAAGFAIGLAMLTKIEVAMPGTAAVAVALAPLAFDRAAGAGHRIRLAATFGGAMLLPPLGAIGMLAAAMPMQEAALSVLAPVRVLLDARIRDLPFFRSEVGLDDVAGNLGLMARAIGGYLLVLGPPALLALAWRTRRVPATLVGPIAFASLVTVLLLGGQGKLWYEVGRPLPLFTALVAVVALAALVRRGLDTAARRLQLRRLSIAVFALALLGKMILSAHIFHYGFVLAAPATMLLVAALVDWIPARISSWGGSGTLFQGAAAAAGLVAVAVWWPLQAHQIASRTEPVGQGADRFVADARGPAVRWAVQQITQRTGPTGTVAVLPEGAMLNWLARRASSVPFVNFMPPEVLFFGEDRMEGAFEASPPDLVVLVHKDTSEFGCQFFGRDYGQRLFRWITTHYRPVAQLGAQPLQGDGFGISILERTKVRDGR